MTLPDLIADQDIADQLKKWRYERYGRFSSRYTKRDLWRSISIRFKSIGHSRTWSSKSFVGTNARKIFIKRIPRIVQQRFPIRGFAEWRVLFEIQKEHYNLSKKIGEEILFRAVKKLQKDHKIVACRIQTAVNQNTRILQAQGPYILWSH